MRVIFKCGHVMEYNLPIEDPYARRLVLQSMRKVFCIDCKIEAWKERLELEKLEGGSDGL